MLTEHKLIIEEQLVQTKQELATALNKIYDLERGGGKKSQDLSAGAADKKAGKEENNHHGKETTSEAGEETK